MDLSVGKYRGAYSTKHIQLVKQMKCFLAIFKQLTNDVRYRKAHWQTKWQTKLTLETNNHDNDFDHKSI